jgi:hypothetical protein
LNRRSLAKKKLKNQKMLPDVKSGDRIKLAHMPNDPDPVPAGTMGTILKVVPLYFYDEKNQTQLLVKWDNGRSLSCVCPPDIVERVPTENHG